MRRPSISRNFTTVNAKPTTSAPNVPAKKNNRATSGRSVSNFPKYFSIRKNSINSFTENRKLRHPLQIPSRSARSVPGLPKKSAKATVKSAVRSATKFSPRSLRKPFPKSSAAHFIWANTPLPKMTIPEFCGRNSSVCKLNLPILLPPKSTKMPPSAATVSMKSKSSWRNSDHDRHHRRTPRPSGKFPR